MIYLIAWIILCMCPASEKQHYNVISSLIGWAHTHTDPCIINGYLYIIWYGFWWHINHLKAYLPHRLTVLYNSCMDTKVPLIAMKWVMNCCSSYIHKCLTCSPIIINSVMVLSTKMREIDDDNIDVNWGNSELMLWLIWSIEYVAYRKPVLQITLVNLIHRI